MRLNFLSNIEYKFDGQKPNVAHMKGVEDEKDSALIGIEMIETWPTKNIG